MSQHHSTLSSPFSEQASPSKTIEVAIIGGGPAGLAAADTLSALGHSIHVFDSMPSLGRKFLMAGRGGLNLTHSEPLTMFIKRYGAKRVELESLLQNYPPDTLRMWARELGIDTFIGSSGRVFPTEMKAAPLLRAWLHRLRERGVDIHVRHKWIGWSNDGLLQFRTPSGNEHIRSNATLLALGGGSWAKLGSDAAWVPILAQRNITVAPLLPANCGFMIEWSAHLRARFAGTPLKNIAAVHHAHDGVQHLQHGECIITEHGIEGGLIYALAAPLRDTLLAQGSATLNLDLLPNHSEARVLADVSHPRGARSLSSHLHSRLGLSGIKTALLYEVLSRDALQDPVLLAQTIKSVPLKLIATRPIDEAISTAGGLIFEELDEYLMLRKYPGIFCAGEMLDWEAPTGGYLLSACFATGHAAAHGMHRWLEKKAETL